MFKRSQDHELDHVPDHIDPDRYYQIDPEDYGFLHRRSKALNLFGLSLSLVAVALFAAYCVGGPGLAAEKAAIPGLGGWAVIGFFGAAAWGVTRRHAWGRYVGLGIATLFLGQVGWYFSSPGHWGLHSEAAGHALRFVIGYLGLVSCAGTEKLFGVNGFSHGLVRWAHLRAKQEQGEWAEVYQMDSTAGPVDRAA